MENTEWNIKEIDIKEFNTVIIGSGAAGLNCALHLADEGIDPSKIAIITEQLGGGTSFNTGSDKQTYYKLSLAGDQMDSPLEMARDLFAGGAMHGDIALIEATNSIREFFHLIQLGVPFPHDKFGGFVGYKTDNDPRQRATSIGPLTSQEMSKCLLKEVQNKNIAIFDNYYAFHILLNDTKEGSEAVSIFCIKIDELKSEKSLNNIINSIKIFQARNIIMATGGPACLYKYSVYPKSQKGSLGIAIRAGCKLQNLTESQFGIASINFRWNLSGSYQQVIPRYFSVNQIGKEIEFLTKYFPSFQQLSRAIFLKGYQWPFNAERIENYGSSLIDLAVYYETEILDNKVYLEFGKNPLNYDEDFLDPKAKQYLVNSNALKSTPIERLKELNPKAIELFKEKGIDITKEPLQIAVCNQHLNGGITGDIWWETNIKHLFAIGEVNGSHGIHRPGGAALNSGQVGGLRAAQKIGNKYNKLKFLNKEQLLKIAEKKMCTIINNIKSVLYKKKMMNIEQMNPTQFWEHIQNRMSKFGGIVRPLKELFDEVKQLKHEIYNLNTILILKDNREIIEYLRIRDALLTQQYILESILNYHKSNGKSRGSYLIHRDKLNKSLNERYGIPPGELVQFKFIISEINLENKIQTIQSNDGIIKFEWEKNRDIPIEHSWFENVWKDFSNGKIFS
jgi:succinate dehydrogenase/fumarate reductase flavoprotein subunit